MFDSQDNLSGFSSAVRHDCSSKRATDSAIWPQAKVYLGPFSSLQHVSSIIQGQACGWLAIYGHYHIPGLDASFVSWAPRGWCDNLGHMFVFCFDQARHLYRQMPLQVGPSVSYGK